jgi:hypothetical protein
MKFIAGEYQGAKVVSAVIGIENNVEKDSCLFMSWEIGDKKLASSFIDGLSKHRFWE